jgi:DNA (cytosine-5)-methyltransferase 1
LGFEPVGFSEIEPFPSAILKHRFPNIPNYGDLTKHTEWPIEQGAIDLLVGGTPCQSFSVAGLRKGMSDPRGNLTLTYLGLADKIKPKWIVYENVPGLLSSNGGKDFGSFLGALVELGYGFAYRVLDAQYFGVPQRRRRVFVVACLGDWRAPAEVLSIREGLLGYIKTRNKKREGSSENVRGSTNKNCNSNVIPYRKSRRASCSSDYESWVKDEASNTLNNFDLGDIRTTHAILQPTQPMLYENHPNDSRVTGPHDVAPTVVTRFGTGGGNVPLVQQDPITFQPGNLRREAGADPSTTTTTTLKATPGDQMPHICYPLKDPNDIACDADRRQNGIGENGEPAFTLRTAVTPGVMTSMAVRRLTPVECERLQGFPDNWSRIPWKGKPEEQCPDGPRYKACGNSMAVPVMRWIGERIKAVEEQSK